MKTFSFFMAIILVALSACTPGPTASPTVESKPTSTARIEATVTDVPPVEATPTATTVPFPAVSFDYDSSIPFDVKINSEKERDGVTIIELSYAGHDPKFSPNTLGRTIAYLVKPHGDGPFAGLLYLHSLGESNSGRGEFLDEAVTMAQHGTVSLLVQGYFPWMIVTVGDEKDRSLIVGQVIALRRATDFLLSQPGVDSKRLGFVGHDYGAVYGGVLSGVDKRFKTFVLIAGTHSFADWAPIGTSIKREAYLPMVQDIDPVRMVASAAPSSLFFQFALKDEFVSSDRAKSFHEAASEPKKVEFYDDLHNMTLEAIQKARLDWLIAQLGLVP